MWGSGLGWSESASISKKIAPGMCFATYCACVSTGGVTPTRGSVASRMTTPGSSSRAASQEVVTRESMGPAYLVAASMRSDLGASRPRVRHRLEITLSRQSCFNAETFAAFQIGLDKRSTADPQRKVLQNRVNEA